MVEFNQSHWTAILKQTAFNMFIGNAERRGRRFGLSNRAVSQTLSSLRDELFDIERDSKPQGNPADMLAQIRQLLKANALPAAKEIEADVVVDETGGKVPVTLESIHSLIIAHDARFKALEARK